MSAISTPGQKPGMRERVQGLVQDTQNAICSALETIDGHSFREDRWTRDEGGGGITRILQMGNVFEKAGVNYSAVHGKLSEDAYKALALGPLNENTDRNFFATGVSLVIHPHNPMVPTVHANYRYFELGDAERPTSWWFGGGSDLTPAYLFEEDVKHFHRTLKSSCDRFNPDYYPRFKTWCDQYFYLPHRGESRGVGGIFFDRLNDSDPEKLFSFLESSANAFLPSYMPIVEKRMGEPFTEQQKSWQKLRRGRYVEFNLMYDRGTKFGLQTKGRTESILMSLPMHAVWEYNQMPEPDSPEAELLAVLKDHRDWV